MSQKHVNIFGIKLDSTNKVRVLRTVREKISRYNDKKICYSPFYIVTPNPEIVSSAKVDQKLSNILNAADISIPDGIGLAAANKYNQMWNPTNKIVRFPVILGQGMVVGFAILFKRDWITKDFQIIRGREIFFDLLTLANKKRWKVYFLGGYDKKTTKELEKNISKNLKSVTIDYDMGPTYDDLAKPINSEESKKHKKVIEKINNQSPHLLFIGLGSPKQERWMENYLSNVNIGGAMVVGRTFEFYAETSKVAPSWMADVGLEWLYRLFTGSTSLKRILTAFPLFPLRVFGDKLTS